MAKHKSSQGKNDRDQTSTAASGVTKKKKANVIEVEGIVLETLPDAKFKVKLDNGQEVLGRVSGKMRMYLIKVLPGDRVIMEMTPYDLTKGRITKRC